MGGLADGFGAGVLGDAPAAAAGEDPLMVATRCRLKKMSFPPRLLSPSYVDPGPRGDPFKIIGLNSNTLEKDGTNPYNCAFLLHRNGTYTKSQDDDQIPKSN